MSDQNPSPGAADDKAAAIVNAMAKKAAGPLNTPIAIKWALAFGVGTFLLGALLSAIHRCT